MMLLRNSKGNNRQRLWRVNVSVLSCRYLVIAWPLWYRRQNIKTSVVVCVGIWAFNLVLVSTFHHLSLRVIAFFFYFPLPLFIFFLGGTLKSLSASYVPSDEKRRIVGILVLVLISYTLLFLPSIIMFACFQLDLWLSGAFLKCTPLTHLLLYVLMRKGIADKPLASVCCCRMDNNDTSQTAAWMMIGSASLGWLKKRSHYSRESYLIYLISPIVPQIHFFL